MASFEQKFALHVPSSTENLAMIRDFVGQIGNRAGMAARDVSMLELAVDEACANVIEHAYGEDSTKDVTIRATLQGDEICIDVVDTGKGFDPQAIQQKGPEALIQERRSGGLGMQLMTKVMDEVRYEIVPGVKNELRMVKKLKK